MANSTVKKISKLKGVGILMDCPPPPSPILRKYNLIYGFNGSGKTTLSRLFASLQLGARHPKLPETGTFDIELSDGTHVRSDGDMTGLSSRVMVFNGDFQEENLRWRDGTASPIFYIGKEQADLIKELEEAEHERAQRVADQKLAATKQNGTESAFATFKRDTARLLAEQLGLGRKYDASNLVNDFTSFTPQAPLEEDELARLRAVLIQEAPLPPLSLVDAPSGQCRALLVEVGDLLETTLGKTTLEDLVGHDAMFGWIRSGLEYHRSHSLDSCLLCGNALTEDRMAALGAAIDSRFDRLLRDVENARQRCESVANRFSSLSKALPSPNDISPENRSNYERRADELRASFQPIVQLMETLTAALRTKAAQPNALIDRAVLGLLLEQASDLDAAAQEKIDSLNQVLNSHNGSFNNFKTIKSEALNRLKRHYLSAAIAEYRDRENAVVTDRSATMALSSEVTRLDAHIGSLNRDIRTHGPAATVMTKMIHNYLGRDELSISAVEAGYQLTRNGRAVKGSLSEGEKTAIALCYFLSTLEAEGRKRKDLIVVIDDPVSSLDTKALNYSFSIIKSALGEAGQLILLTHNLNFMNEAKKWLRNKTEAAAAEKATASLLFLDSVKKNGGRASVLIELPKYIRDYESEYHYLFHLILRFLSSGPDDVEAFYVIPNALRKVLEIFLAFKLPGPNGLSSKIESIAQMELGMDPVRVHALDRLVQVESHADNLEDLVAFSSMTVEETRDAAEALTVLMEALDAEHFKRLSKICK